MTRCALVQLQQLSFSIPDTAVCFESLDLNFASLRYGIVGDNGIGMTTLLKLLKTTQNLNQQNNAEILCKNDYALSF